MLIFLILFCFVLQSQYQGPNGNNYTNQCQGAEPFADGGIATVWFNDSDNDCWSNDFVIRLLFSDGASVILPGTEGFGPEVDFGIDPWECCNNDVIGGGGSDGGDSQDTCPCTWEYEPSTSFLLINCDC